MYIKNPTEEDLRSWYKCFPVIANYLLARGLPIIYVDDDGFYYFVKTQEWGNLYRKMPFWIKIFEIL